MAHILCCNKYGYHLPLYRQSQMFENEGIDLSGSLMAGWVGKCTKLLERVSDALRDHMFEAQAIFIDDTTVNLLQKGNGRSKNKSKTARLSHTRKEDTWASGVPSAVWYQFSTSRGAEHPTKHLKTYTGFAHADAYAGYNDAYRTGRVKEMTCMAHVRREFVKIFEGASSVTVQEAIEQIAKLYDVETQARFLPPAERVALRQKHAKAIRYALARMPKARPYLDNGFLELDNNTAERAVRLVAVGRKNYLFMDIPR